MPKNFFLLTLLLFFSAASCASYKPSFDIIYVKQPRHGPNEHVVWPEAFQPGRLEPNSDLILLKADGTEEVLFDTEYGAVTDPFVSFDGKEVFFSLFHDVRPEKLNKQRGFLPLAGADIYKIDVETKKVQRLTFQEFTPNTGTGNWDLDNPVNPGPGKNALGYGILNLGPAPIANGKLIFSSNRNGFRPTKSFSYPTLQLYTMDKDGRNVEAIAPMTIGSALHPTPLVDGRVIFSSYESQGLRNRRLWGLWSIYPDGRKWEPVVSAFKKSKVFHFMTQTSDGSIVFEDYYNLNNFGFGTLHAIPPLIDKSGPMFHSAFPADNPKIETGNLKGYFKMPFTPKGMYSITPLSSSDDNAAEGGAGKYTHPSAAPDNDLLVVWSDGPVNKLSRPSAFPAVDSGIYLVKDAKPIYDIDELIKIKNDPEYNEVWPRALVPYYAIYGQVQPRAIEWLPNDGTSHEVLPAGTPYGLIGTSSFYNRETFPGIAKNNAFDGLEAFNSSQNYDNSNWLTQGADAGKYDDKDIWAVRILLMEPNPDKGYGPDSSSKGGIHFFNHANEKLRILGEIPLRKFDGDGNQIIDYTGKPDTSFLAKIPADTPFTFQTLDKNGLVLNMSQTWHQVRPGEVRTDCGGCHAHSKSPVDFNKTAAAKSDYKIWDLTKSTPLLSKDELSESTLLDIDTKAVDVEFVKDIRPILRAKCVSCHTDESNSSIPGNLPLNDVSVIDGLPMDYSALCSDRQGRFGVQPILNMRSGPKWRGLNASRYIRKFQSRRSLLTWKIFGQRLDGWDNDDLPTEAVPGDVSTFPENSSINSADIDYVGDIMPPDESGLEPLTIDEKMNFGRWIDLGCPIDLSPKDATKAIGWYGDDVRPTLNVSVPARNSRSSELTHILIGLADAYTGIDLASLNVSANFPIDGFEADENFASAFEEVEDGVFRYDLAKPLVGPLSGTISFSVKDIQGNTSSIDRTIKLYKVAPRKL